MSCVKYRNCAWIGRLSKSHQKICKNSIAVGCCAKYYSIIWPMLHDYVCRNKLFVINDWGWCVSEQSHHSEYGVLLVRMHTVASVDVSKYIILCALYLLCDVYWIALSLFLSLCVGTAIFSLFSRRMYDVYGKEIQILRFRFRFRFNRLRHWAAWIWPIWYSFVSFISL